MKAIPIPYEGLEKYVFISYSHKDKDLVYQDIQELINQGVRVWFDQGIPAGPDWDEFVHSKILSEQCSVVIFYVSENSVRSNAIADEIRMVFEPSLNKETKKDNFSVHIGGKQAYEMLFQSSSLEIPDVENTSLVIKYFNKERKYISRYPSESNHLKEIIESLARFNVIDEKYKYKAIKRTRKFDILFIGKKSVFTKSIKTGIDEKFSSEVDFNFNSFLIDATSEINPEKLMIEYIEKNEYMVDGFLLRPIHDISHNLIVKLEELIKNGKKIILLDKDLNETQKASFKADLPMFLGSNFAMGGQYIAKRIDDLITSRNNSKYKIILLDGPKNIVSADFRVSSLKKHLQEYNHEMNTTIFIIDSFNVDSVKDLLEQKLRYLYKYEKNQLADFDLYIYLANDNIAKTIIKSYREENESYIKKYISRSKSVVFIGYDGIKDFNNNIDLFNFGVNSITVDVLPTVQGMKAAEVMIDLLTTSSSLKRIDIMPEIRDNINLKPRKGKSIMNLKKYLKDKKLIIFDLDGTIANTEMLHFKSYRRLLGDYNLDFRMKDFENYIGNPEIKIWEMLSLDYNLDFDINNMMKKRTEVVLDLIEEEDLQPFDYFTQVIKTYSNTEKVILSSQLPEVIYFLINKWKLNNIFPKEKIFSVSDRQHTKLQVLKDPNKYYKFMDSNYSPEEVIIFEDSNHTLKIAKEIGIDGIGIEHHFNHNELTHCKYIINEEICSGVFIGLAGMDIVHYQVGLLPEEDTKSKTDDYAVYVGGPAANAAIVFALLGGDATLISCIGDSEIGKAIKGILKRYGVTVIDAIREENTTPNISSIIVNKVNGHRTIISGQNAYNDKTYKVDDLVINNAAFVMYDCNTPLLFSANVDQKTNSKIVLDAGSYKPHVPQALMVADEVICSNKFMIDKKTIFDVQEEYNISFAGVTNGPHEIRYRKNGEKIHSILPPLIENVIDTLGAGDAFHGAYCYYRFQKKMSYSEALKYASEYASKTVEHRGIVKID